jgi:hypothetical protein
MADLNRAWPEELGSPFAGLGQVFEKSARAGVVILRQESDETRAQFEVRLAGMRMLHHHRTLFVCLVCESRREDESGLKTSSGERRSRLSASEQ